MIQVSTELKDFLKKNINETYEGRIDTKEEFSLGLDYAQVYVSIVNSVVSVVRIAQ